MNRSTTFLSILSFCALTATCGAQTFKLNQSCDTFSDLKIIKVVLRGDDTSVTLRLANSESVSTQIWTPPPGHKEAFFILDPKTGRKYQLTNVEGIAIKPAKTTVRAKGILTFTLAFQALPSSITRFHLIEGEIEPTDQVVSWRFMNVRLKRQL